MFTENAINGTTNINITVIISILIAIGALLVLIWQLHLQRKNDRYNRTYAQIKRLEDREFRIIRYFIFKIWKGQYPLEQGIFGSDENGKSKNYSIVACKNKIQEFSNTMDVIGKLYMEGYIDHDTIINLYGPFIQNAWKICKNFIDYEQQERNKLAEKEYNKTEEISIPPYPYQHYFREMVEDIKKKYPTDPSLKKEVEKIDEEILKKLKGKKK